MKKAMRQRIIMLGVALTAVVIAFLVARGRGSAAAPRPLPPPTIADTPRPAGTGGAAPLKRRLPTLAGVEVHPSSATDGPGAAPHDEPDLQMREFQAKVTALIEECSSKGSCQSRQLLTDQVGLAFDLKLGPDHPKRSELVEVVGWSFDAREALSQKFLAKEVDRKQLFASLTDHFADMGRRFGALLDDVEYETMFGSKKGENPADYLGLTPQMAENLDRQAALNGGEGPAEDMLDPEDLSPETRDEAAALAERESTMR